MVGAMGSNWNNGQVHCKNKKRPHCEANRVDPSTEGHFEWEDEDRGGK
jgi:hypothetical protein